MQGQQGERKHGDVVARHYHHSRADRIDDTASTSGEGIPAWEASVSSSAICSGVRVALEALRPVLPKARAMESHCKTLDRFPSWSVPFPLKEWSRKQRDVVGPFARLVLRPRYCKLSTRRSRQLQMMVLYREAFPDVVATSMVARCEMRRGQ